MLEHELRRESSDEGKISQLFTAVKTKKSPTLHDLQLYEFISCFCSVLLVVGQQWLYSKCLHIAVPRLNEHLEHSLLVAEGKLT